MVNKFKKFVTLQNEFTNSNYVTISTMLNSYLKLFNDHAAVVSKFVL